MSILRRVLLMLAIPSGTAVAVVFLLGGHIDRVSDGRRPLLRFLDERIEDYASDSGHLPAALTDLLESKESAWRGPYVRPRMLHDLDGAPISYEVIDARTFRITLPARIRKDSFEWPAITDEHRIEEPRPAQ
jgi:hypothetical protein